MAGTKVYDERSELKQSGNHEFTWNPTNISTGTYYVSINIHGLTYLRKIVYIGK